MTAVRLAGAIRVERVVMPAALLAAASALTADSAGLVVLGWGWCAAIASGGAGLALLATAPPSRSMFVGAIARTAPSPREGAALRVATVVTAPLAGVGPVLYAILALAEALYDPLPRGLVPDWRRALGTALLGLAWVLAACELELEYGASTFLWPLLLAAAGLSAIWWLPAPSPTLRAAVLGLLALMLLPVALLTGDVGDAVVGVLGGAAGVALIAGPRMLRDARVAAAERARRARAEERAEVGELLHDSVLQTLALIQSRADDPAEVRALARHQERDLRARLFGDTDAQGPRSIAGALRAVAAEVEDAHRVKIDVVTVSDGSLGERANVLVAAAREALVNAATHAAGAEISLFAEVEETRVRAYVRDRGPGFALDSVPADRRGLTHSIVARMVRHGGEATIRTAPGGGCEVRLVMRRP